MLTMDKSVLPSDKANKSLNQLRWMEDAIVIYRMARAPERRLFYIDVGNLPKAKAENYLRDVMARYRTKVTYDQATGEIRDDKKVHVHAGRLLAAHVEREAVAQKCLLCQVVRTWET